MAPSKNLAPPKRPETLRRLSSMTATAKDVREAEGKVIIVPEHMMLSRPQSYHGGFAASLETAREELSHIDLEAEDNSGKESESTTPQTPGSPVTPADLPTVDTFAFAFDIDGVLIRGGKPIPEAIEAMKVLNGENEYHMKMSVYPSACMDDY